MNKAISDRKLDALLTMSVDAIVEKNAESFLEQDYEIVPMPNSLRRKILGMDRRARWKNEFGAIGVGLKRVAAVILIASTLSFAAAMSVEAVRTAIWNAIVTWYDDYVAISFRKDGVSDAPETIVTKKEPMMDGYEREVLLDSQGMFIVNYVYNDFNVMYSQLVLEENEALFDNTMAVLKTVKIGAYEGQLLIAADKSTIFLMWNDGEYAYTLQTDSDNGREDQLIHIAQSVQ